MGGIALCQGARGVVSFGLGRGRTLEPGAWGIDRNGLPPSEAGRIGPEFFFTGRDESRPFDLEIGSGKGTFLLQQSALEPATDFLGIEWTGEFYRYAADRIRRHERPNVRVLYGDAVEFLSGWLRDGCVRVIHLYFSDPWPKGRHHKRRVIQDHSLAEFHRVLQPGGELRIVTDHDALWAWMQEHAARHTNLFSRSPFERPASAAEGEFVGSNFERKYAREGRPFHSMTLTRVSPRPCSAKGPSVGPPDQPA
ncbi:MAG: tRNA (guanosine(46)-N7)-methyltransferase TrmB [Planctomycetota bacterium]|nr:tRNA (guanosine(46)-N7)-methyltransferase TrmB [Planctomycetota bacterium]MDA1105170.1 tRNA (guanosine(46)-N7)-methyltransferase TrmB [Planctomycetota bacterium]